MLFIQTFECEFSSELHTPGQIGILDLVIGNAGERRADPEVIDGREQGLQEDQNCRVTPAVVYA